jgi:nucleoside-diphosphate-sugar epimerase
LVETVSTFNELNKFDYLYIQMILVTGGTGLVGSHLLVELTKENQSIRAIYRTENRILQTKQLFTYYFGAYWEKEWLKIDWIQADLTDIESLKITFEGITHVYHTAGNVSFHSRDFKRSVIINRHGTANIVNLCLKFSVVKLAYVSSTAAVGGDEKKPITEADKWKKTPLTSGYSVSKYLAEKEVWRGIEEGLTAVIINPCVILGPGNWDESSLTILKTASKGLRFYPTGSNASVDVRDVAVCLKKLMQSTIKSERFLCIGSNQPIQVLLNVIADQTKVNRPKYALSKRLVRILSIVTLPIFRLFGAKPPLSKDAIDSAYKTVSYNSDKLKSSIDHSFYTLSETIENSIRGRII